MEFRKSYIRSVRFKQWSSTRGPPCGIMLPAEDFLNAQLLNKIRADIDISEKKK
jgi:hypothetical protein